MTDHNRPEEFLIRFGADLPVALSCGIAVNSMADSGKNEVVIHPNFLQKLAANPMLESTYRNMLMSIPEAACHAKQKRSLKGEELIACGCYIDERGGMSTWSYSRSFDHVHRNSGALYEQSTVFNPADGIHFPDGLEADQFK